MKTSLLLMIILLTFAFTCKEKIESTKSNEREFIVPKKDLLSEKWVSYKQSLLNERNGERSKRQELKSKATLKMKKGIQSYKIKNDSDAVREYEEAIDLYPLSELYYHYGNSLANLNRLEDSIYAYKISLSISNRSYGDEYRRPELAMYNLACSYSRLNQLDEAYSYLAQAVDRGYNAFAYIEKDPDMENLRKEPDWKERIRTWRQEYNYNESNIAGLIKMQGPRQADLYYLCKNGIAILASNNYCSEKILGYEKGKWQLANGDIKITIEELCAPNFIISKEEKEKYDFGMRGAATYCPPGIPEFNGICNPKKNQSYDGASIGREVVKEIIKKPERNTEQDYNDGFSLKKLNDDQEPKQCDPNFIPKTLEDITIQKIK